MTILYVVLFWFLWYNPVTHFQMLCCSGMKKIVTWWDHHFKRNGNKEFHKIWFMTSSFKLHNTLFDIFRFIQGEYIQKYIYKYVRGLLLRYVHTACVGATEKTQVCTHSTKLETKKHITKWVRLLWAHKPLVEWASGRLEIVSSYYLVWIFTLLQYSLYHTQIIK